MYHERFGEGPPLVAVHGLGSNLRVWHPVREQVGRHHELIGVHLPGFGESPRPVGRRGVRPLVDALEAWLDEQGLEQPHLTGYSMGARIVSSPGVAERPRWWPYRRPGSTTGSRSPSSRPT